MDWHSTVRDGNLRQIRDMIRSGVDINQKDTFGMTALHYAAEEGHLEIVRLLLQKGALASVSNHGETPLQLAQDNGHSEICKLL
ncbi:ankyrin repeat protein, partial [Gorgonomyces haynaldii]